VQQVVYGAWRDASTDSRPLSVIQTVKPASSFVTRTLLRIYSLRLFIKSSRSLLALWEVFSRTESLCVETVVFSGTTT
jgi:hypothetical protein